MEEVKNLIDISIETRQCINNELGDDILKYDGKMIQFNDNLSVGYALKDNAISHLLFGGIIVDTGTAIIIADKNNLKSNPILINTTKNAYDSENLYGTYSSISDSINFEGFSKVKLNSKTKNPAEIQNIAAKFDSESRLIKNRSMNLRQLMDIYLSDPIYLQQYISDLVETYYALNTKNFFEQPNNPFGKQ